MTAAAARDHSAAWSRFRTIDLDRGNDELATFIESSSPHDGVILHGATPKSLPLVIRAARLGIVVAFLPRDADDGNIREAASRVAPTREAAYRDIALFLARERAGKSHASK